MTDEVSATSVKSSSALSSTTEELFRIWQSSCCLDKPKNDKLRQEACSFFTSLASGTQVQTTDGTILTTKPSHEEALAVLIRQLGPAFEQSMSSRLAALHCLWGALQGCPTLSVSVSNLVGNFLLQHCGPIAVPEEEDNVDDDIDEEIRNVAIQGLSVLCQTEIDDENPVLECVRVRLSLAQKGVERRCAEPELDEVVHDHGYGAMQQQNGGVPLGLSTLPRSRRALCFGLIRSTVDGIAPSLKEHASELSELKTEFVDFAKFTASCLHGESDPRCLQQLLQLFYALQLAWTPVLKDSNDFPISEIFDAVAPYYPIQFTPPPNDVYGITREGLQQALFSVMSYTEYDGAAAKARQDTMMGLSLGIIMERLLPPEEDGPPSISDQLEGMQDLSHLLFGGGKEANRVDQIELGAMQHLSATLITVHDQASMAVGMGGSDEKHAKQLADLGRLVISKIALDCERATTSKKLWETIVAQPLRSLSSRLGSSPSENRTAIAYMACLASSGGPKTLKCSLEAGLVPLLGTITPDMQERDDDLATAAYGIGAFFSSCRVAIEKAHKDGVTMHPHPLEPYSAKAVDKLYILLDNNGDGKSVQTALSVRIAAVRAIDSVLVASPASLFNADQVAKITELVVAISAPLVAEGRPDKEASTPQEVEWLRACTQTIGGFLGKALEDSSEPEAKGQRSILQTEELRSFLQDDLFSRIASSVVSASNNQEAARYDRRALAIASSCGLKTASRVVRSLMESLNSAVRQETNDASIKACGEALSYVLSQGGRNASQAFQELAEPEVSLFGIIDFYSDPEGVSRGRKGMEASFGTSMLQLPPTAEDREALNGTIAKANEIAQLLLPAYRHSVSQSHLEKLVVVVSHALPPLSPVDTIRVSTTLPLLAAALHCSSVQPDALESTDVKQKLESMTIDLADFALSSDFDPIARSNAGYCLYAAISKFLPRGGQTCPSLSLLKDAVIPSMLTSIKQASKRMDKTRNSPIDNFASALSLSALLGAAAASRGGISSKTADKVILFLVDLAGKKLSEDPFSESAKSTFDLARFEEQYPGASTDLAIAAASSFGSILSGGGSHSLWKQRLTHIATKRLQDSLDGQATVSLGALAVLSHIICSSNIKSLSSPTLQVMADALIQGLSPNGVSAQKQDNIRNTLTVTKLMLAATVKLLSVSPDVLSRNLYFVVTGAMHSYAASADADEDSQVACKLLALQVLEAVAQIQGSRDTLSALKPAVVSILGAAMNDSSSVIRYAGVEVRNAWYLVS